MKSSEMSRKERVHSYLKKNRRYIPGADLTTEEIGGKQGLRRLRELRAEGVNIISRRNPDTGTYEYKLGRK